MDGREANPVIVLGEEGGARMLAVPSGAFEASSVIMSLEGIVPPRPLPHDLIVSLLRDHGFTLDAVELYGVFDDGYLCRMRYRKGLLSRHVREIRPSDGIALAVRTGAPLLVSAALFDFAPANRYVAPAEGTDSADIYYLEPDWAPRSSV